MQSTGPGPFCKQPHRLHIFRFAYMYILVNHIHMNLVLIVADFVCFFLAPLKCQEPILHGWIFVVGRSHVWVPTWVVYTTEKSISGWKNSQLRICLWHSSLYCMQCLRSLGAHFSKVGPKRLEGWQHVDTALHTAPVDCGGGGDDCCLIAKGFRGRV